MTGHPGLPDFPHCRLAVAYGVPVVLSANAEGV